MYQINRNAFTMLELVFVIAVIGILSGIAIPRFAATRDDALITKGISTLAAVRNAIATERQKRILRGDFTGITDLSSTGTGQIFTTFNTDARGNANSVLEYPIKSGTESGQWNKEGTTYTFYYYNGGSCAYTLASNKLTGSCSVFGD